MPERIEQIKNLLSKQPDDVFLNYSLAMELASSRRRDEALKAFQKCISLDSKYLPAYVEAGKCLRSLRRFEQARQTFQAAMKIADSQGEGHLANYIRQQMEALPDCL